MAANFIPPISAVKDPGLQYQGYEVLVIDAEPILQATEWRYVELPCEVDWSEEFDEK